MKRPRVSLRGSGCTRGISKPRQLVDAPASRLDAADVSKEGGPQLSSGSFVDIKQNSHAIRSGYQDQVQRCLGGALGTVSGWGSKAGVGTGMLAHAAHAYADQEDEDHS